MVLSLSQLTRLQFKLKATTSRNLKKRSGSVNEYRHHCKIVFEAKVVIFFCLCQKAILRLFQEDITQGTQKENRTGFERNIFEKKEMLRLKMWECSRWNEIQKQK